MLLEKLRILPFFILLAAVACSGGAGTVGSGQVSGGGEAASVGGPVGGGGAPAPGGTGSTSNAAAPLQGGFSDPSGDPEFRLYAMTTDSVVALCDDPASDKVLYQLKGRVDGLLGKAPMDGRILRVILTDEGKFFDETLIGTTYQLDGETAYYGTFDFTVLTTVPFMIQTVLLSEGVQNSGEALQSCTEALCPPADAVHVKNSLSFMQLESVTLQECSTQ
ncbi:MAG TPA: hypothetical protein VFW62_09595 [bacterium]|nr:hypothetical protein [bacterium]